LESIEDQRCAIVDWLAAWPAPVVSGRYQGCHDSARAPIAG